MSFQRVQLVQVFFLSWSKISKHSKYLYRRPGPTY